MNAHEFATGSRDSNPTVDALCRSLSAKPHNNQLVVNSHSRTGRHWAHFTAENTAEQSREGGL